jgi:hypothetical protein
MERWQFNACIQGYGDRRNDDTVLAVYSGYWSAYYNNAKRPKPVQDVVQQILSAGDKKEKDGSKPDVDVAGFLAMEAEFNRRMALAKGEQDE